MFTALKDYNDMIMKPSWRWLKKHWKGYLVLLVIIYAVPYLWWYSDQIKEYFQSKFRKKEEEEES